MCRGWEKVGEGGRRLQEKLREDIRGEWERLGEGGRGCVVGGRKKKKVEEGGERWEKVGEVV